MRYMVGRDMPRAGWTYTVGTVMDTDGLPTSPYYVDPSQARDLVEQGYLLPLPPVQSEDKDPWHRGVFTGEGQECRS